MWASKFRPKFRVKWASRFTLIFCKISKMNSRYRKDTIFLMLSKCRSIYWKINDVFRNGNLFFIPITAVNLQLLSGCCLIQQNCFRFLCDLNGEVQQYNISQTLDLSLHQKSE